MDAEARHAVVVDGTNRGGCDAEMLLSLLSAERLHRRWLLLADRIGRYSPAAAEAYRQAAADLRVEISRQGVQQAIIDSFVTAVRAAVRAELRQVSR